jgi:hypothetical protein
MGIPFPAATLKLVAPSPAGQSQQSVVIPNQLQHAAEFVQFLQSAGLQVQSVQRSHLEAMFNGVSKTAFITTDRGIIEVVFFPGPTDAEQLTITYSRASSQAVRHRYRIQGWPPNGDGTTIDAAYPLYFTLHKNLFIQTLEPELEGLLKRALGQTNRPARPGAGQQQIR